MVVVTTVMVAAFVGGGSGDSGNSDGSRCYECCGSC